MKRKIARLFFYSCKFFIGMAVYLNSRLYMKLYNKLLKTTGLKISGTPRFIAKSVKFDDFNLITLGDRLVVSSNVIFLTHDYSYTTSLISINKQPKTDIGILGPIFIGNNVFIGMNTILLPGTKIGNNVIVGAGSVIRGTIPDNSVVSGNPAVVIADIKEHAERLQSKNYFQIVDPK
jgi:acetyltransferase-like isoleucine patch superfamily enzyme